MPVTAYLADLRYDYSGVLANDCMPLGVAYMKAVIDRDLPEVKSRLFVYPERLWEAMQAEPPDILMVSNYMWCEELSFHFARLAKRLSPNTLVVMGGPNIPLEDARQIDYVDKHPEIDLYVLGEGDFLAAEVVKHFLDCGKSLAKFRDRVIPSAVFRRSDGRAAIDKIWDRHKEVDEIPSPWLTGIQDEFFDGKLAPLIETNRGCPFTCTFCVQGTRWYTKVHNFSKERIREEIQYIARRIHEKSPEMRTLRIADSNYGMYERDIEISSYLGETQKQYGWPMYIDATTGKNRPDRIIKSLEQVSGALVLYQAVQSLDENVLRNVKRSTIKLEAYEQLQVQMMGRGLRSNSDLILGLPGETLDTHLSALRKLLNAGVDQVTNFQLMMLKGSELEAEESRKMFSFRTLFRVLPKNFGIYGGEKVMDIEEIAIGTDTLTFDDYVQARKYALASVAFWHDNTLADVVRFAESFGVKKSEWLDAMLGAMEKATGVLAKFLADFVTETKNELFPTREACVEFYTREENFERLSRSEIGDNLMHKYQAIASFHIWPQISQAAMDATRQLLLDRGASSEVPDFEEFWAEFARFETYQHAHGSSVTEILSAQRTELRYDIAAWLAEGMPKNTRNYRLESPREAEFRLSEEGRCGLGDALQVWTAELKGLTKLMKRIRVAWQVRECHFDRSENAYFRATAAAAGAFGGEDLNA
jgi:radical SAM superfamily enzyme YgiQ (UPF0313 family)